MLPGQKLVSTHLSDIFNDIRDYMGVESIFGFFLITLKRNNLRHELKKIYVKTSFNIPLALSLRETDKHIHQNDIL